MSSMLGIILIKTCSIFGLFSLLSIFSFIVDRYYGALGQRRSSVYRLSLFGISKLISDFIKLIAKEPLLPTKEGKFRFIFLPILCFVIVLMPLAGIPFLSPIEIAGVSYPFEIFQGEYNLIYIAILLMMAPLSITFCGIASDSKFAVLGASRYLAQLIGHGFSVLIALLALLMHYQTFSLQQIVYIQNDTFWGGLPKWGIFLQPVSAFIFFLGMLAMTNRTPFNPSEAKGEIVGGYFIEYSSVNYILLKICHYGHMSLMAVYFAYLFCGGHDLIWGIDLLVPFVPNMLPIFQVLSLFIKTSVVLWIIVWAGWSLPRLRHDQILTLGWKFLLPLGLINFLTLAAYYVKNLEP